MLPPVDKNLQSQGGHSVQWRRLGGRAGTQSQNDRCDAFNTGMQSPEDRRTVAQSKLQELGTKLVPLAGGQTAVNACVPLVQADGHKFIDANGCQVQLHQHQDEHTHSDVASFMKHVHGKS